MRTLKLTLEYDGTDFVGWQSQVNGRAVQDEIEKALRQILSEEIRIAGAGRTDSGVHARGQVASLKTSSPITSAKLLSALNGVLPEDICTHAVEEVPDSFHARFDATGREYSYTILFHPAVLPRRYSWYTKYPLTPSLLHAVAPQILGKHDFSSFCKHESEVENRICTVSQSVWQEIPGGVVYHVVADRFVHGMVRSLVGTMVDIARGHFAPDVMQGIFRAQERSKAGTAAPAKGLVLERVEY